MLGWAKHEGVELPVLERALDCYDQAARDGWSQDDNCTVLFHRLEQGKKRLGAYSAGWVSGESGVAAGGRARGTSFSTSPTMPRGMKMMNSHRAARRRWCWRRR